jgi:hypothetical protein
MNEVNFKILKAILAGFDNSGWDYWSLDKTMDIPGLGNLKVTKVDPGSRVYDDGVPTVIIFELNHNGETLYFRKSGYQDSYGYDTDWTGEFRQVKPVEKVIYDYV